MTSAQQSSANREMRPWSDDPRRRHAELEEKLERTLADAEVRKALLASSRAAGFSRLPASSNNFLLKRSITSPIGGTIDDIIDHMSLTLADVSDVFDDVNYAPAPEVLDLSWMGKLMSIVSVEDPDFVLDWDNSDSDVQRSD